MIASLIVQGTATIMSNLFRDGHVTAALIMLAVCVTFLAGTGYLLLQLAGQARLFLQGLRDKRKKSRLRIL